jgi:hypothetical protein
MRGGNGTRAGSSSILMNCPPSPAVRFAASIRPAREIPIDDGEVPPPPGKARLNDAASGAQASSSDSMN